MAFNYNRNNSSGRNNFKKTTYDWDRLKKMKYRNNDGDIREQLITEDAKRIATFLGDDRTTSSQLRQFYGEVKGLELRIEKDGSNFKSVYPFILMLKPKVAYKVTRRVAQKSFQDFIDTNIDIIKEENKSGNGLEAFQDFCIFFECIVGYFPKK